MGKTTINNFMHVNLEILLVEGEVLEVLQVVAAIVVAVGRTNRVKVEREKADQVPKVLKNQVVKVRVKERADPSPNPKVAKVRVRAPKVVKVRVRAPKAVKVRVRAPKAVKVNQGATVVAPARVKAVAIVVKVRARVRVDHQVPRNQVAKVVRARVKERADITIMEKTYSISNIYMEYQDFLHAFGPFLKDLFMCVM